MTLRSQVLTIGAPSSAVGLVVGNLSEIAMAFGDGVAARVLVELASRVENVTGLPQEAVTIGPDGVYFPSLPEVVAAAMRAVNEPVRVGDAHVVMALTLPWSGVRPVPSRMASPRRLADDMAAAAAVYDGIRHGRACFVIQPICRSPSPVHSSSLPSSDDGVLYWECLSRVADASGRSISPASFIPALERSSLTRSFDAHVVSSTLDLLGCSESMSLGCNISAQSAFDDEWWSDVVARLHSRPELASRLVIEITETSPVLDEAEYIRFIERMHSLGCRIALDDFGKGFHSIDLARKCRPDIIKIDACFLPRENDRTASLSLFERLVSLAGSLAGVVVVEGVENEAERMIVAQCGASWMQGYHFARPSSPEKLRHDIDLLATGQ